MTERILEERLSDDSDKASRAEEMNFMENMDRLRSKQKPAPRDWDSKTCYECEADLPAERIAAGRYLCVRCKTLEEKRDKGY